MKKYSKKQQNKIKEIKLKEEIFFKRSYKILSIIAHIFVLLCLVVIANTPPAGGYEMSIYGAYPWYFWFFLITPILIAVCLTLHKVIYSKSNENMLLIWFPALMSYLILFLLPFFRGYYFYGRGDALTHLGYTKDILSTSSLTGNGYPISHTLVVIMNLITNINLESLIICLPALFVLLYIVFVNRLAKTIFNEKNLVYLCTLLALIVNFVNVQQFAPWTFSSLFIPFFLYAFYNKQHLSYVVVLLSLVLLYPFFHVLVTIMLIVFMTSLWMSDYGWQKMANKLKEISNSNFIQKIDRGKLRYDNVILVLSITGILWAFHMYPDSVASMLNWILHTGEPELSPQVARHLGVLQKADLSLHNLIILFWVRKSNPMFFYAFPLIFLIFLSFLSKKLRKLISINKVFFQFFIVYVVFVLITLLLMTVSIELGYGRAFPFVSISSLIVSSIMLSQVNNLKNRKNLVFIVLLFSISFLVLTTVFTVHSSPINKSPNSQVTKMEVARTNWFSTEMANEEEVISLRSNTRIDRFYEGIYGENSQKPFRIDQQTIPDEFGYDENKTIAKSFSSKYSMSYMFFSVRTRNEFKFYFKEIWDYVTSYSNSSVVRLNNDNTANKVYSNSQFEVWLVKGGDSD